MVCKSQIFISNNLISKLDHWDTGGPVLHCLHCTDKEFAVMTDLENLGFLAKET
jgi:hypothetical protein